MSEEINLAKKAAGEKAASLVKSGMLVGLGTGSTAYWAIKRIGEMVADGLKIKAVATSKESEELAKKWDIPIVPFSDIDELDIDIDGADEVDPNFNLIKGGGGALLREKIIAAKSRQMIVVADESKSVDTLGKFPLPVEVVPFGIEWTIGHLKKRCQSLSIRQKEGAAFITDNGNYILDCDFYPINHPKTLDRELNNIPGVVENGLFINLCTKVIIGE
ncbi:MAG TPA: ribose-5-phosphate isomerase RpiA [Chitinophagaceae bacterium]|nr:ribose-5-phosphate isomerase RpiA [Chitinophagaceae bacterium]